MSPLQDLLYKKISDDGIHTQPSPQFEQIVTNKATPQPAHVSKNRCKKRKIIMKLKKYVHTALDRCVNIWQKNNIIETAMHAPLPTIFVSCLSRMRRTSAM